jgi:hypothetical protein
MKAVENLMAAVETSQQLAEGQNVDHFGFNVPVAKRVLENPTYAAERTPKSLEKRTRSNADRNSGPVTAQDKNRELLLAHPTCRKIRHGQL